jgi:hypothetical protein
MAKETILNWQAGYGWLVFSGGWNYDSDLHAEVLARANSDGAIAYISFADDGGDALLNDMEELGAPTGFMIDVRHETEVSVIKQLEDIAIIVIESGDSIDEMYNTLTTVIVQGILEAYQAGALILVEGLAINLFGRWVVSDGGEILDGLNWVENTFLEPNVTSAEDSHAVQDILTEYGDAIAIEIGSGSALALGINGQIEILGERQVTISLGKQYRQDGSY